MTANERPTVKAAETSVAVLEAVRRLDDPGVSDVARELDRSKSGIYKHLRTLTDLGYLSRSGDAYRVGLGAWGLAATVTERFPLADGRRSVDSLAASTDRSVTLVLYEDGGAYYAYQNSTPAVVDQVGGVGDQLPLHASAAGKAILGYLPARRRDEILAARSAPALTGETITDQDALRDRLESVSDQRTAVERGERATGITAIAAPILASAGSPVGAISVVGATQDLDEEALDGKLPSLVVNASRSVENALGSE